MRPPPCGRKELACINAETHCPPGVADGESTRLLTHGIPGQSSIQYIERGQNFWRVGERGDIPFASFQEHDLALASRHLA